MTFDETVAVWDLLYRLEYSIELRHWPEDRCLSGYQEGDCQDGCEGCRYQAAIDRVADLVD